MFEDCAVELVMIKGFFTSVLVDTQDVAFGGVESHPPVVRPLFKLLEVVLESHMVVEGVNLSVQKTVISEEANLGGH